jgi:hypothetical protein
MDEIIKQGKVEDNIYFLPEIQLDRKEYLDIAKHLEFLGGKWNRGKKGFIFDREISSIDDLLGNNIEKKKKLQFFETPKELADRLVELAEVKKGDTVLEPSAGRGRIIEAIIKKYPKKLVHYCEIDSINREYINKIDGSFKVGEDFLEADGGYDKIIANPPFAKNQDIDHILQMYKLLKKDGILVSIASKHWEISSNKKETKFREWLESVKAEILELEGGEFKESGTMIQSVIIKIRK